MFRRYNKKILTAIIIVVVGIGLIGPGVLLIFAPSDPSAYYEDFEATSVQEEDQNGEKALAEDESEPAPPLIRITE